VRGPKKCLVTVNRVTEMAAQGLSAAEIGRVLHKSRSSIVGIATRNDIQLAGNPVEGRMKAAAERKGVPYIPPEVRVSTQTKKLPELSSPDPYIKGYRHYRVATCCWAGCKNPPKSTGKPFCVEHS
jgi:hypothetical protein